MNFFDSFQAIMPKNTVIDEEIINETIVKLSIIIILQVIEKSARKFQIHVHFLLTVKKSLKRAIQNQHAVLKPIHLYQEM